ncbi:uncharacterized protein LOC135225391 [Macrobrachium nipponense]|uniref:uncharacterized protein LOC135225391 n=1 Tax=Macrobrachium nipponense TaxID=159736 RepID=UPI0030C813C9
MSRNEALKNWYVEEFEKLINDGYMTEVTAEEDVQWKSNGGKVTTSVISHTLMSIVPQPHSESYLMQVFHLKEKEVKTLRLLRNSWGTTPAGGICSVAMLIIAEKFKDKYPQVYEFVKSNLYVDDGTTSVDDVSTALQLAKELNIVLSRINFSKKRRGIRSEEDISLEDFDDAFPDTFSRRNYLQIIATIYDPTGLATPVTICLKHELGQIFRLKQEWDDPILDGNDDLPTTRSRCKEVIRSIYGLKEVSSQTAYGCVAYYNWKLENGERASVLAMSKAEPWPQIPTLTIPRGELLGCLLGARMQQTIVKKSSFIFERVMLLTDSTIVLGQLRHEPYKFNMWTASRISEIQTLTDIRDWYHVDSGNNVADDASRGLNPSEMGKDYRWQKGPDFMKKDINEWPVKHSNEVHAKKEDLDIRIKDPRMTIGRCKSLCVQIDGETNEDYSVILDILKTFNITVDKNDSLMKIKRRISRIIRFMENASQFFRDRLKRTVKTTPVAISSMTKAERSRWFAEMIHLCLPSAQQSLPSDVEHKLKSLNPILDADGVWRALGRTGAALSNPPVIIPYSEPFAEILVHKCHQPQHSGADTTLALVREQFWILNGKRFVSKFVSQCPYCRFLRKKIAQVEIAPRKVEQLVRSPVFEHVVIDIAGPFNTIADRRETRNYRVNSGKAWILVIVCRASGAAHIEVLEGYDTNCFLAGFDAFTRIRGKPTSVTADLGSQIRVAANVMESLWNHTKIAKIQTNPETTTTWHFVPSGAHSSVGQAERMIRTVKNTLEAVTASRKPEFTKLRLQRLMYSVADMINDRPLGVHRNNVAKLDAVRLLRPNDLILGRSSALLPREKWSDSNRGVEINDIVIIRDTNPVRNKWHWGEVVSENKSSDNITRSVSVRYKSDEKSKFVTKSVRDLVVILRNMNNIFLLLATISWRSSTGVVFLCHPLATEQHQVPNRWHRYLT